MESPHFDRCSLLEKKSCKIQTRNVVNLQTATPGYLARLKQKRIIFWWKSCPTLSVLCFNLNRRTGDLNGTSDSFSTVTIDTFSINCRCNRITTTPYPNTDGGLSIFVAFPAYATFVTSLTLALADVLTWVLYWQCRTKKTQALLRTIGELFGVPWKIMYHLCV